MEDESNVSKFNLIFVCNRIAYLYSNGLGVSQSSSKAFSYYMKAAHNDDPSAESSVADAYFEGDGVTKDINKAIFWYEKSARQNYAYSWYSLGFIYAREIYGHYNAAKAVECLNKAIECDKEKNFTASAFYELGKIYENGGGSISKSCAKAGNYYKKAAELGHDKAKEKMKEFE
jgi:TPR repeat protein